MNYPYKQIAGKSWKTWTKNSTGAEKIPRKLRWVNGDKAADPFARLTCDQNNYGGGWTVLMRRTDGSEDFYRDWKDYKKGFGQLDNEFFLGLEKFHALTYFATQELMVVLEDYDGNVRYQHYESFMI